MYTLLSHIHTYIPIYICQEIYAKNLCYLKCSDNVARKQCPCIYIFRYSHIYLEFMYVCIHLCNGVYTYVRIFILMLSNKYLPNSLELNQKFPVSICFFFECLLRQKYSEVILELVYIVLRLLGKWSKDEKLGYNLGARIFVLKNNLHGKFNISLVNMKWKQCVQRGLVMFWKDRKKKK